MFDEREEGKQSDNYNIICSNQTQSGNERRFARTMSHADRETNGNGSPERLLFAGVENNYLADNIRGTADNNNATYARRVLRCPDFKAKA